MSLREIDITKFRESDNNTRCNEAMEIDKGNLAATKCVAIEGVIGKKFAEYGRR